MADPDPAGRIVESGLACSISRYDPAEALLRSARRVFFPNDPHARLQPGTALQDFFDNPYPRRTPFDTLPRSILTTPYLFGAALAQLKQYPQAIDAFQHALKLEPAAGVR